MSNVKRFEPTVQLDSGLIIPASAGAGKLLTSDSSGNATWQPAPAPAVPWNWAGLWSGALAYAVGDVVNYFGSDYRCKAAVSAPSIPSSVRGVPTGQTITNNVTLRDALDSSSPADSLGSAHCLIWVFKTDTADMHIGWNLGLPATCQVNLIKADLSALASGQGVTASNFNLGFAGGGTAPAGIFYFEITWNGSGAAPGIFTGTVFQVSGGNLVLPGNNPPIVDTAHWSEVSVGGETIQGDNQWTTRNGDIIQPISFGADPTAGSAGTVVASQQSLSRQAAFVFKGDGATTAFNLPHNFGRRTVIVQGWSDNAGHPGTPVHLDYFPTDNNTIQVTFPSAPAAGVIYYVQVIG